MNIKFLDGEITASILALLIGLYAATVGSKTVLPSFIRDLFSNAVFRVVFLSTLLIHAFKKTPHVAFAVSLIFVLTMHLINKEEISENLRAAERYKQNLAKGQ